MSEKQNLLAAIQSELEAAVQYRADASGATNDEDYHAAVHALWWANNRISQMLENLTALV